MASRYSRYDPDRRSRSPRDRSPGRFDPDRRRPPADVRSMAPGFQSTRDDFSDLPRREPPRGPRALVDPPSGPRGGFGGDFRGGRGRGRGWAPRDDSRDRGRDRDLDFRDRYRDDRNRDRDGRPWPPRDRDHRPPYPPRVRSPLGRPRSPPDFRDRDRDGPPGPDTDRPRRNSRDGPLFVGASPPSDKPHFDMPRGRGGFRGRGRGRGDWGADRGRGRAPFDDRGDRYIRSRSQEGRQWNRDREERERMDRFADPEPRRDPRDDRDRGPGPGPAPAPERELFRAKMEARAAPAPEGLPQSRDVSPPPVAPSAPAFGSVPDRSDVPGRPGGMSRPPPTGPRALSDRQGQEPPSGPSRMADNQPIPPSGPRHQTPKQQRSTSHQWINPNYRKSPQMARAQSFAQPRPAHSRPESSQYDYPYYDDRRPRSSDSRGAMDSFDWESRRRSHNSVESGEIMNRSDDDNIEKSETHHRRSMDEPPSRHLPSTSDRKPEPPKETIEPPKPRKQGRVGLKSVRFSRRRQVIQPKAMPDPDTDSDEEDLGDFFNLQIEQTEAELGKLKKPELPLEVVARFASTSHSAMVKILNEPHGLADVLGEMPKEAPKPSNDEEVLVAESAKLSVVPKEEKADVLMADAQTEPPARPKEEEQQARLEETDVQPKATSDGPIESDLMLVDKSTPARRKSPVPGDQPAEKTDSEAASAQDVVFETTEVTPEKAAAAIEAESTKIAAEKTLPTEKRPWAGPDHEQSPKVPSTPSQVDDDGDDEETETEEEDAYVDMDVMRGHMLTPPLEDLPRFDVEPFNGAEDLMTLDDNTDLNAYILQHLEKVHLDKTAEQEHARAQYAEAYHAYLKFTLSDDPVAIKVRDKLSVAAPTTEVVNPATPEPAKPEGRSARRFGSERDLELALQASLQEQTEREEREKKTQSGKHRGDKEAEIPDMLWGTEEQMKEQFFDTSGWVPSNRLVSTWEVLPPTNNFTPEEAELFEKRYLELPKQWGKVAEVVPNRDFGTCIQYYYLRKRDLNLKEKLRRQPKKRKKGRGKQRSSALVSELGNGEGDADDNTTETGENGETRRRPRRAAAPTWNFEQPAILLETESATPVTTPGGRRGASAAGKSDQPDKPDGRKRGRKTAKSSEPKIAKPNPTLAAAPGPGQTLAPGPGRARARSDVKGQPQQPQQQTPLQQQRQPPQAQQPFEFQGGMPAEVHRLPAHYEQPQPIGMQPPFSINQPSIQAQQQHQPPQPTQTLDRSQPMPTTSSMAEVIAAPSLRPEPPALQQPSLAGPFTHGLTQSDRKNPAQASSYWSVSESNDFPGNLRAFGSDWTAIAAHMGSKTAVMVKNYYVRQKEGGKNEWEKLVREADSQRMRGEKRPDPPIPSTSGRGRRYDGYGNSRPIAAAPGGGMDLAPEGVGHPMDGGQPQQVRTQFGAYSVPIAQAPASHQQQQPQPPQPLAPGVPKSMSMQPQPNVSQAMSPNGGPPLRDPSQYNLAEREREIERERERHREREMERAQQRVPLPGKSVGPMDTARRGLPSQPLQSGRVDVMPERSQQMDMLHHQQQLRERERERERELEREREREEQRDMMARQADRRGVPVKAEPDMSQRAPLDPYSRMGHQHRPEPPRHDPLSLSRHAQEPPRHGPPPAYSSATHSAPPPPHRGLLGDQSSVRSPPPMGHANGPPTSRPISALQHRHSSSSAPDIYGQPPPQASTPVPAAAAARAPEPRKSTIMSLLNDDNDAPTPSKRVSDLAGPGQSSTPPPQGVGRSPAASQPPQHMRRDSGPYSPFGRPPSTSAPGMPSLKPTYSGPPSQPSRSALSMSVDPPQTERDYFRQQQGYHPSSANESPQSTPLQYGGPGRGQGPPGYPTSFGGGGGGGVSQTPTASSPPPQYPMHAVSRSRDMGHGGREQWQHHQGSQPPPQHGGWGREPPKSSQPPHQAHAWAGHPGPGTPKASSSSGMWPAPPPPQQQQQQQQPPPQTHPGMRDERGPHMYGSQQQQQQQAPPSQHQMQGRYGPPPNRGLDPVPSPAQAYARYASTPGPGPGPGPPPRDPRDMPGRSYTPVSYDGRGHPPPQGYQGDMQMRDPREQPPPQSRDPRDMMGRGLRPPPSEYDRHPDNYGR